MNIGILNLMPDGQQYEKELSSLCEKINSFELKRISLTEKTLNKDSADNFETSSYSSLVSDHWLDVLIITGSPVERKNFEDVSWWNQLNTIITDAINRKIFILGICWGGMAIAKNLGIEKTVLDKKVFGLKKFKRAYSNHPLAQSLDSEFYWPVSTHAVLSHDCVQEKIQHGCIYGLAHNDLMGYGLLISRDSRVLICLAHPEYRVERLLKEHRRDWGTDLKNPDFLRHGESGISFSEPVDKALFFRWFELIEEEIGLNV